MKSVHLGVDTATPFLSLGLWPGNDSEILGRVERVERAHGSRLLIVLDDLMEEAGVQRRDLTSISVGVGPGSYTGIKVGAAAALGLAKALSIPLYGVDTLAAMAYAGLAESEQGWAVIDARRGNVYAGLYHRQGDGLITLEAPAKLPRASLPEAGPRLIEDVAPHPGFLARGSIAKRRFEPMYL